MSGSNSELESEEKFYSNNISLLQNKFVLIELFYSLVEFLSLFELLKLMRRHVDKHFLRVFRSSSAPQLAFTSLSNLRERMSLSSFSNKLRSTADKRYADLTGIFPDSCRKCILM